MKMSFITACFVAIFFITVDPAILQAQSSVNEISREELRGMLERNIVPSLRAVETVGTPYIHEEFAPGRLTFINERVTESLLINFNAYQNRIEFRDGNNILAVPGENVNAFFFKNDDKPILFKKGFSARGLDENDFVQIMAEGDITFIKKYDISFQENVASYGVATQRDEYISNERYYIVVDGEVNRIRRLTDRAITSKPDAFESEMEAFKRERRPDLSSEMGAALYFNHYNQLIRDNIRP